MVGFGIKRAIDKLFNDTRLITYLTINKVSVVNSNFGYGAPTVTVNSTSSIKVVPANYIQTEVNVVRFGELQEGDLRFFCSSDEDVDEGDQAYLDGIEYKVIKSAAYWVANERVAKVFTISKKIK